MSSLRYAVRVDAPARHLVEIELRFVPTGDSVDLVLPAWCPGSYLIRDYALPVPTTVIAEMLGVPVADRHHFHRWSKAIMSAASSTWATSCTSLRTRIGYFSLS